jgi:heat shock protein HslJ
VISHEVKKMNVQKLNRTIAFLWLGMLLAACTARPPLVAGRSTNPELVLNRTWQWVSTVTPAETIDVPHPERYTILLQDDGNLQARFDCNRGGGNYTISTGQLSFGPLRSTRMACPGNSLDTLFMGDLQQVVSFFIDNGRLYLALPYDSGTMTLRTAPRSLL